MRLDKLERNAIFKAIAAAGLDPRDFELDTNPGGDVDARISHRGSGSYFTLTYGARGWSGEKAIGERPPWPYDAHAWSALEKRVVRWLEDVKRDIETPDLWAELQREREMLAAGAGTSVENTPFTADEQAEIAEQLREIKEYAKRTYALSENETLALEAKLTYLEEAVARLGRLDWRAAALGTLFSLAAEAILAPEDARHLLLMLLQRLGQLLGYPIPELPGG